jgi:hypothetical protein
MSDSPAVGHIGFHVPITRRENGVNLDRSGRVWFKPFLEELMNGQHWELRKEIYCLQRWRLVYLRSYGIVVCRLVPANLLRHAGSILDEMPRQWHVDGSELNYELDGIFASVSATELS